MDSAAKISAPRTNLTPAAAIPTAAAGGPRFGRACSPRFGGLFRFAKDDSGAAAIEYGLLAALVALAMVTGLDEVGGKLKKVFDEIGEVLGDDDGNGKGKGPKKPKKPK